MSKFGAATRTNKLPTNTFGDAVTQEIMSDQRLASMNCTKQLLGNLKNGKYTHLLKIIYGMRN